MSMIPICLQLEQMEESEVRLLKELGLERRAKQLPSLTEYLSANGKAAPPLTNTKKTNETNEGNNVPQATTPEPAAAPATTKADAWGQLPVGGTIDAVSDEE
jgi:hypothetical protein